MFDKPTAAHVIGIEKDGILLRAAQLSLVKGKPRINKLFEVNVEQAATDVNLLYKSDQGRLLQESLAHSLVVTGLNSDEVLIRPLEVKLKKEQDINAVLAFQAEPLIPYPVENAIIDRIKIETMPDGTQLNILAARKDHVRDHLSFWNAKEIEPEIVTSSSFALAVFSKTFFSSTESHFIVHIGLTQTLCVLVKEGKLLAAQNSHLGLNDLNQVIESPDSEIVEQWRTEITRILYGLGKLRREESKGLLFTGEGASQPLLRDRLIQTFSQPLLELNPIEGISSSDLEKYAIPIGAAVSGLPNQKSQINFRKEEFAYPYPWKRLKQPLITYFVACCALAVAIYLFGLSYYNYKEDHVRHEYVALLASMNKSYSSFEKEYAKKFPAKKDKGDEEGVPPIHTLTQEDISNRLHYLQKEMKDSPISFPLLPDVPKISDVFAWLSNHPIVNTPSQDSSGNLVPSFQIEHFSYSFVKRPDQKKPQEKYQVKVELEFSSPTPKLAREFHDALIAPNELVDPKGEVKWGSNRGKYRTSFFLKDKTIYP